jgi:predicted MFS family arabinose efflux permease
MFPFAIMQLFAGSFSDIVDRKKVVYMGYFIFLIGLSLTVLSIFLRSYVLFLMGFLFQGIGFSFINPTVLAIISIITPEKREGLMMGLYNSSAGIGVSGGAIISGLLANIDWRLLFILNPIITVLSLILFIYALKNCEALVCRTYELNEGSKMINIKLKIKELYSQLQENFKINILLLGMLGFFAFFGVITLTNTLNDQIRLNIPYLNSIEVTNYVSLILTVNGLISVGISPFSGNILNKIRPLIMIAIGFFLMIAISGMPLASSIPVFMMISFTIYLGSAFIWPALFKEAMDLNPEARGTNSAIINSLRFLGYSMVGVFYAFFNIPVIYYFVLVFVFVSLIIILLLMFYIKT